MFGHFCLFPKLSRTFQDHKASLGSGTGVGEAEDAGRVSVSGWVEPCYPASEVPADVVDVVVPVDRHGGGVRRTHCPQGLAHRTPHLRHLTWGGGGVKLRDLWHQEETLSETIHINEVFSLIIISLLYFILNVLYFINRPLLSSLFYC